MTIGEIILTIAFYFVVLAAVAYFTRAKMRRVAGALAGCAGFAVVAMLALALGEARGWWRVPKQDSWPVELLFWLGFALSCAPVYLIVWRVVRRFGSRGLAVCVLISAVIGPPRDYWVAATFPRWMTFAPGIAPVLGDSAIYALLVIVGYAVMRMVAGPAREDALARD